MNEPSTTIYIGDAPQKQTEKTVHGAYVTLLGEPFYRIQHFDEMAPFFMSIVSGSDHWLFISSTGGLSAGRVNAESALFPYYTEDKLTENAENTGNRAMLRVRRGNRLSLWEPFSPRYQGCYSVERNLYKNTTGSTLLFEEINHDLGLTYRYSWRTSDRFGFVKTSYLLNDSDSVCEVELVDGLQNLLPANVTVRTQMELSSLLDAYKRSECDPQTGLGVFSLNATLTDKAEPSESLAVTTIAPVGLPTADYLLSTVSLERFRKGLPIAGETAVRGQRCAYFVHATLSLAPSSETSWYLIADVQQDSAAVTARRRWLQGDEPQLRQEIEADIATNQQSLWKIVAAADGIQQSENTAYSAFHFANVLFNVMRGGIFADQYNIDTADFREFVGVRNRPLVEACQIFFATLPPKIPLAALHARAFETQSTDLLRLSYAYLPLIFSRRHGDPSRPWNWFSINIKKSDGSPRLDYQGNWRDIFQNWEALAYSYPEYTESMIATFLNGTTADGYNPYRITRDGLDWETPDPGNPWANIGYWSDHQIIYLLKLLEISEEVHPGTLNRFLTQRIFSYADVPYRLKPYAEILQDPYNTIRFDWEHHNAVEARHRHHGSDGKLVFGPDGQILHGNLTEKLMTLLLAKLTNFVPEGGIWMNTQRPEWNDANNALVGKGVSVVTLAYLRRFVAFCEKLLHTSGTDTVSLASEVVQHLTAVTDILHSFQPQLSGGFTDEQRRAMMDALGEAGGDYRAGVYAKGLSGGQTTISTSTLFAFFVQAQAFIEHALRANRRDDNLYHSYNVLHLAPGRATIGRLSEMLEGQVAVLSSGLLNAEESLALLQSLRQSALYRSDQHSYILYPDRELTSLFERNRLDAAQVEAIPLVPLLTVANDTSLIVRDIDGEYHFSSGIRNFQDVEHILSKLRQKPEYADAVESSHRSLHELFEATFHHTEFTGRSGTFFAYEGLGSIYWHMVAKLLLAAEETALRYRETPAFPALRACYADIRQGLSFAKTPAEYGAFPADPYSHTPKDQGARQPGMTGMVKETMLTRQAELGYRVKQGGIVFDLSLLDRTELLTQPATFTFLAVSGEMQSIAVQPGELAYTICQTPVILRQAPFTSVSVHYGDGQQTVIEGNVLPTTETAHLFARDGVITQIIVATP